MRSRVLLIGLLMVVLATNWHTPGYGQVLYEEHFTDGQAQLDWYPFFGRYYSYATDTMQVIQDPTTPEGDGWIGAVAQDDSCLCGMTWSGNSSLTDYSIEAWVFVNVDTTESYGLYQGLCGRLDTTGFWGKYYRFIADLDRDQRLRLSYHYGEMMPVYLRSWSGDEMPGGVPSDSSWHRMKLRMVADSIWAYWDGVMLPGCPILHDSLIQGYFGIYTFRMWMDPNVATRVDSVIIREESEPFACGDCNGDGRVTVADATYLVSFIYRGGLPPVGQGDVNLDSRITIADATYIISYVYRGGPPPCEPPMEYAPYSEESHADRGTGGFATMEKMLKLK